MSKIPKQQNPTGTKFNCIYKLKFQINHFYFTHIIIIYTTHLALCNAFSADGQLHLAVLVCLQLGKRFRQMPVELVDAVVGIGKLILEVFHLVFKLRHLSLCCCQLVLQF